MSTQPPDSSLAFPAVCAEPMPAAGPTALELEVTGLFDELRRPLLRYLVASRLTAQDAEEVVQEVFLALFRHLQAGKPRENLRGWVFRVGHNLAIKRGLAVRDLQHRETAAVPADDDRDYSDPAPGPEDQLSLRQRRRKLLAVVSALPERDRCCLRLRAEGLRYREIAHVLGISLGAVAVSLSRSLARLSRADSW